MKTDNMLFQELTADSEAEIREMSAMASAIVREHYDPILGKAQNDYMLEKFQSVPALRDQLAHGYRYFFARSGEGRDLGFLAFYPRPGALYLSKLYLYKEARGHGYARIMLDFLRDHARKLDLPAIELNVNRFNPSVAIYGKMGFRRIREEKNDIGHGYFMDDYVYRLELRPKESPD